MLPDQQKSPREEMRNSLRLELGTYQDLGPEGADRAVELFDHWWNSLNNPETRGRAIAGAALYVAINEDDPKRTQEEVSEEIGISTPQLRKTLSLVGVEIKKNPLKIVVLPQ